MTHTKDEALKLALEALEQLQGGCTDHDDGTVEAITVWCPEVIDAIKQALAAPDLQAELDATNRQVEILSDALAESRREVAASLQPVALLKEADVLMMAEAHGIDPSTNGLYGFCIDCISNQPEAQP